MMRYSIFSQIGDLKIELAIGTRNQCQLYLSMVELRFINHKIEYIREDNGIICDKIKIWFEPVDVNAVLDYLRAAQINPASLNW